MRYMDTGKINSGINNFIPINSRPSTPSLTPNQPIPPITLRPNPPSLTPQEPLAQEEVIVQEDDGNLLFWVLVGMFVLGILRG